MQAAGNSTAADKVLKGELVAALGNSAANGTPLPDCCGAKLYAQFLDGGARCYVYVQCTGESSTKAVLSDSGQVALAAQLVRHLGKQELVRRLAPGVKKSLALVSLQARKEMNKALLQRAVQGDAANGSEGRGLENPPVDQDGDQAMGEGGQDDLPSWGGGADCPTSSRENDGGRDVEQETLLDRCGNPGCSRHQPNATSAANGTTPPQSQRS